MPLPDSQAVAQEQVILRDPGAKMQHGDRRRRKQGEKHQQEFSPEDMLSEQQLEARALMGGPQQHTLLVGGARSQKTFILVYGVVMRAMLAARSRHLISRFRQNAVRQTIGLDTLPRVCELCFPRLKLEEHRLDSYFTLPNGSEIWLAGLDEKERVEKILGFEFATILLNECSQIPYGSVTMLRTRLAQLARYTAGTRVGTIMPIRGYYDLNPVGTGHWTYKEFYELVNPETRLALRNPDQFKHMHMTPVRNPFIAPNYVEDTLRNLPERQRKRFLEGIYVPEVEGALWTMEVIERNRLVVDKERHINVAIVMAGPEGGRAALPPMRRVVVAVDPSGASGKEDERSDEIGIVVAGLGMDGQGYVLADRSLRGAPEQWGSAATQAYIDYYADAIVAETNFGADMVRFVIEQAAKSRRMSVKFRKVTASRGKVVRAEPVSVLYEQDRVKHVGEFHVLEDQMLNMSTAGYQGMRSPDRLDALVWALSELMIRHVSPWANRPHVAGVAPASIFGR